MKQLNSIMFIKIIGARCPQKCMFTPITAWTIIFTLNHSNLSECHFSSNITFRFGFYSTPGIMWREDLGQRVGMKECHQLHYRSFWMGLGHEANDNDDAFIPRPSSCSCLPPASSFTFQATSAHLSHHYCRLRMHPTMNK